MAAHQLPSSVAGVLVVRCLPPAGVNSRREATSFSVFTLSWGQQR
jgi:hypothetical protein